MELTVNGYKIYDNKSTMGIFLNVLSYYLMSQHCLGKDCACIGEVDDNDNDKMCGFIKEICDFCDMPNSYRETKGFLQSHGLTLYKYYDDESRITRLMIAVDSWTGMR